MGGFHEAKKAKLTETGEEAGGSPTAGPKLLDSMGKLRDIQDEIKNILEIQMGETVALEKKFMELRKPIFARRNEVIESIHEFWLTVFASHPTLGNLISKEDEKILKYLVTLEVEEDTESDSIIFHFSPNPYFDDTKLTKTYCCDEVGNLITCCEPIMWKEGKVGTYLIYVLISFYICLVCILHIIFPIEFFIQGVSKNSGCDKGGKRPYTSESFFTWFCEDVRSDGQPDEIAKIIRDDLWPNPLKRLQKEVDAMGQEGEEEEVSGGGNEIMNEDEDDDNKEVGAGDEEDEVVDEND